MTLNIDLRRLALGLACGLLGVALHAFAAPPQFISSGNTVVSIVAVCFRRTARPEEPAPPEAQ